MENYSPPAIEEHWHTGIARESMDLMRSDWFGRDKSEKTEKPERREKETKDSRSREDQNNSKGSSSNRDFSKDDGDWHMTALRQQEMDPEYRAKGDEKMREANNEALKTVRDGAISVAAELIPGGQKILDKVVQAGIGVEGVQAMGHARKSVEAHQEAEQYYRKGIDKHNQDVERQRQEAEQKARDATDSFEREKHEREVQNINDRDLGIALGADQYR